MNKDTINPDYYKISDKVQVIDITESLSFCLGNAVKYCCRAGKKDRSKTIEDLNKAIWYIKREIERLQKAESIKNNITSPSSPHLEKEKEKENISSEKFSNDELLRIFKYATTLNPFILPRMISSEENIIVVPFLPTLSKFLLYSKEEKPNIEKCKKIISKNYNIPIASCCNIYEKLGDYWILHYNTPLSYNLDLGLSLAGVPYSLLFMYHLKFKNKHSSVTDTDFIYSIYGKNLETLQYINGYNNK